MAFVGSQRTTPGDPSAGTPDAPSAPSAPFGSVLPPGVEAFTGQSTKRTRMLLAGGATVALGAACLYTFLIDPNSSGAYPQCPLKAVTGLDCPGCGGLRATHALLHGDIIGAADHNILALILLPIMAVMFARWVLAQFEVNVTLPRIHFPRAFTWITPALLVAFSVARNIDVPGLYWLNSGWS